ncbi:hypothetical protein M408DRAFT_21679 [Serendipita vermifera MAFF 305830]|uniref:MYND-type domain-containing protein n=1 Tax=Serendipita vermifera MAFF 305830 TaxID=933852 RepID=A0A0C2XPF5_SERVB|nr:hypothetical protein M408DRAFT_21679 [Serendipita vermifera MAFF 305830]
MSTEGPDFAAPKLREWQRSLSLHSSQFPELPVITLQDLSANQRDLVKRWYRSRDWEKCSGPECPRTGSQYIMKKCAGCGAIPASRTYYCSRRCQRDDWPEHKEVCGLRHAELQMNGIMGDKSESFTIWSNWMPVECKRTEGLAVIWIWAFNQVLLTYPDLDLRETGLKILFFSSELGKGNLIAHSYQLYQLEPMERAGYITLSSQDYQEHPGSKMGSIAISVDGVPSGPYRVDLHKYESTHLIEQWPWIFATIAWMHNRNRQLATYRLQQLYTVVETLVLMKRPEILHYRCPKNLDNGEIWPVYDLPKWQKLFRKVVSF